MHPTVALSVVLLSWCLVRNRSRQARLLLAGVAALLGWEPALSGNRSGVLLLLIATGFAVSLAWDLVSDRLGGTPWPRPVFASAPPPPSSPPSPPPPQPPPAAPPPQAPAASQAPGTVGQQPRPAQPVARRIRLRRTRPGGGHGARPMPGVTHSTPPPPVPPPPSQSPPPPAPPPEWSRSQRRRLAGEPLTDLERADAYGDLLEANLEGLVDAYRNGDVRAQAAFAGEIADVAQQMEAALRVVVGERYRVQGGGSLPHPGAP